MHLARMEELEEGRPKNEKIPIVEVMSRGSVNEWHSSDRSLLWAGKSVEICKRRRSNGKVVAIHRICLPA